MKDNVINKWYLRETYDRKVDFEEEQIEKQLYHFLEGEEIYDMESDSVYSPDQALERIDPELMDIGDWEIICRVAASKFLTTKMIYEYLTLSGCDIRQENIGRKVKKLIKFRILKRIEIKDKTVQNRSLQVIALDQLGNEIAYNSGVIMHAGVRYFSDRRKEELGIKDYPWDVMRILVANQLVLGYLKAKIDMERFGFMETLRMECEDKRCIVRSTLTVRYNKNNHFLYEVVRKNPEWKEKLIDKMKRFYLLLNQTDFRERNTSGLANYPQLVLVGEDVWHTREINMLLKREGIYKLKQDFTPLFTEDELQYGKRITKSLYSFDNKGKQIWYSLPVRLS